MAPSRTLSILHIEACSADAEQALSELSKAGFEVSADVVDTLDEVASHLAAKTYDVVFSDYRLSGWIGTDALKTTRQFQADIPFILVTGTLGDDNAAECLKLGVTDVVLKDRLARLPFATQRALNERNLRAEHKVLQDALKGSEARFRNLVEASPDAIFVYCAGKIVFANPATLKLLGAETPEQIIGKSAFEFIHPNYLPAITERIELDFRLGRASAPLETVYIRMDGSFVDIEAAGISMDWHGMPAIEVVARDITERKRAQRTVLEWQKRLELAEQAVLPIGLWEWNVGANTLVWSDEVYHQFGYTRDSFRGIEEDFLCRLHHEDRPRVESAIQAVVSGSSQSYDVQFRVLRPDGSVSWLHSRGAMVPDAHSKMIGIVIDITRLRRSEADYRSMVEMAPYGIFRSSLDGQFSVVNPALIKMLGYDFEGELLSLDIGRDIYCNEEERAQLSSQLLITGILKDAEAKWKCKDGSTITVSICASTKRKDNGEIEAFQGFIQDVTERKSLEQQFWRAQKMEAIGRLAGGVAHDFNNVLMIVGSYADLIKQRNVHDDQVSNYVNQIRECASRAVSITRQLLAFSRQQILQPEILDLNKTLEELTKVLPRLLGEDIAVVTTLEPVLGRVKVDRGQMEQVLMNLAVNSRDAMPKGGHFEIKTQNIEVDAASAAALLPMPPGPYVKLSVSDSGTGMSVETKLRIFEPFYTTKERGKGTGLGLATVYGIVKQSGGFIWLTSDIGRGTMFEIYLPCVQEPLTQLSRSDIPAAMSSVSGTILLVEDEAALRFAICEFLESKGYNVLMAGSGTEAIRTVEQHTSTIDVIITDLVMPGMDGIELVNVLAPHCTGTQIMYMSGYTERAEELLDTGALLLKKPFSLSELASKLRSVLNTTRINRR